MDQEAYTKICERLSRIEVLLEQGTKNDIDIKATLADHEKRLIEVENGPDKKDAAKWQTIADYIFKFILTVVVGFVAVKIGIQ